MFGLGATEVWLIFLVILLLFGGAKLPQLARSAGSSISEFKKAIKQENEEGSDKPSDNSARKESLSDDKPTPPPSSSESKSTS